MHIHEGTLSIEVCAATGALSLGAVGYSLHRLKESLADRTVPTTGMMAALVFAGQMVNFPIGVAPVSGHLIGGVLASVVLGPWAGCIALTLVLVVQCFLFADGGALALGANVLNMAVVGSLGGYAVYAAIRRLLGSGARGTIVGSVVAAWLSVMAAAALFCLEFGLSHAASGDFQFLNVATLMVAFHSVIGVGEALITGSVVGFILLQRPDLIYSPALGGPRLQNAGRAVAAGIVCALAVAAFLAPFASELSDGLEAVAERTGFSRLAVERSFVFSGYDVVPAWQKVSVSLAGILGTLAVLAVAVLLERSLSRRMRNLDPKHE